MVKKIGIIGFGRIGSYILEQSLKDSLVTVDFVYDPITEKTDRLDKSKVLQSEDVIASRDVDLIVEAADFRVVQNHAPTILKNCDLMILSVTALANRSLQDDLARVAESNGTKLYIPHGAILGMDGLFDARKTLEEVEILTIKNPRNIDFSFTDEWDSSDITGETVLYDGPTRGICSMFPRNVNAHAVVALSCLGFDKTKSKLVSDPNSDDALQHIVACGGGALLEIKRSSVIKGVTGDYTLASIYGSVVRAVGGEGGLTLV